MFLTRGGAAVATIFFEMQLRLFVINEKNRSIAKKSINLSDFLEIQRKIMI